MLKIINKLSLIMFLFVGLFCYVNADIDPEIRKQMEAESFQRQVEGFYDMQYNRISQMEFTVTNTGMTFYDQKTQRGTGKWPRGSMNCYIFGGGIWVGTEKMFYVYEKDPNTGDSVRKKIIDSNYTYKVWDRDNPKIDANGDTTLVTKDVIREVWHYEVDTTKPNKLVAVSYNPNSAKSVMTPGRIEDGDLADMTDSRSYRVYFSLDYNTGTGEPLMEESGPAWPIWDISTDSNDILKYDRYFGFYIKNQNQRTAALYPRGPAFISGEDIFTTYKDTDLTRYTDFGGVGSLSSKGYPQRIQYEQMIYSWGFGDYRDFIFIKYDQINHSVDTLWNMWLAPVFDVDITLELSYQQGAQNDITSFYGMEGNPPSPDPEKARRNMAYQYSKGTMGETGRGFGYCGFVFLESPAVIGETKDVNQYSSPGVAPIVTHLSDSMGFIRKDGTWLRTDPITLAVDTCWRLPDGTWYYFRNNDSTTIYVEKNINLMKQVPWYPVREQLGLVTFRNWSITYDPKTQEDMYGFISRRGHEGPVPEGGDMRYMMATGPFHMRPGDTSRTVVGLVIAATGKGGDADGTDEDLGELVRKVDFMQRVYDENFRAPQPPDYATINSWEPLNNGMVIHWDSTSELSTDAYEKGMHFLGYRIYRARRLNLDTFDANNIGGNALYPSGKGPFGWRELVSFQMPTAYVKSLIHREYTEGSGPSSQTFLGIDSLMPIGPYYLADGTIDLRSILCVKVPKGVVMYPPYYLQYARDAYLADPNMKLGKLDEAGWYDQSKKYAFRVAGVVNDIDSSSWPWGKYLYEKSQGYDFENKALFAQSYGTDNNLYRSTGNFVWDSSMLVRLELNPALALINPLFYEQRRVTIPALTIDSFYTYDTIIIRINGREVTTVQLQKSHAHWITEDSLDPITNLPVTDDDGKVIQKLIKVDTLYELGSEQITQLPSGQSVMTINTMTLRADSTDWLRSLAHYNMVVDSIYRYFESGWVRQIYSANFSESNSLYRTEFVGSDEVKQKVIIPTMDSLTNHRTFVDVGDIPEDGFPSGNAYISKLDDPERTENLYNNVEYYYKVVAFDEGDFLQPTPRKNNVGLDGLPNLVKTYPASDKASERVNFSVIGTEGVLGGLHNFNLFAIDEERVAQLFAGDTLELEFTPIAYTSNIEIARKASQDSNDKVARTDVGLYYTNVTLINKTKGIKLFETTTQLETTPCLSTNVTTWVDNAALRTGTDSLSLDTINGNEHFVDMGYPGSRQSYDVATVQFTTGDFREDKFCYSLREENMMWGNIGFSFNAALKQYGGVYRGDSVDLMGLNVTTKVTPLYFSELDWSSRRWYDSNYSSVAPARLPLLGGIYGNKATSKGFNEKYPEGFPTNIYDVFLTPYNTRFDNGPGIYEVEFTEGGEEALYLKWTNNNNEAKKFNVKYLNVKITDSYSYNRPDGLGDSVEVKYPSDIPFMELPSQPIENFIDDNNVSHSFIQTPSPANLPSIGVDPSTFYRKFNLYAHGYVEIRNQKLGGLQHTQIPNYFVTDEDVEAEYGTNQAHFVGTQGRYYLTAVSEDGKDTIDFAHVMNIAGAKFVLSYLKRGVISNGRTATNELYLNSLLDTTYGADFKVGDKIKLMSWGGVSGFPEKSKVTFAVSNPYVDYTDEILDEVKVVPNPYVITHQNQKSSYGPELYFTKLPPECTIDIFTVGGDLITSLNHNEQIDGDRKYVEVYDLLTKNGQRVQSQTLIALIKSPNGAMTTKHFSVIVGGFRVVD